MRIFISIALMVSFLSESYANEIEYEGLNWKIYYTLKNDHIWKIAQKILKPKATDSEIDKLARVIIKNNKKRNSSDLLVEGEALFIPTIEIPKEMNHRKITSVPAVKTNFDKKHSINFSFIFGFGFSSLKSVQKSNSASASLISELGRKYSFRSELDLEDEKFLIDLEFNIKNYQDNSTITYTNKQKSLFTLGFSYKKVFKNKYNFVASIFVSETEYLLSVASGGNALFLARQPGLSLGTGYKFLFFNKKLSITPSFKVQYLLGDELVGVSAKNGIKYLLGTKIIHTSKRKYNPILNFTYSHAELETSSSNQIINDLIIGFGVLF